MLLLGKRGLSDGACILCVSHASGVEDAQAALLVDECRRLSDDGSASRKRCCLCGACACERALLLCAEGLP